MTLSELMRHIGSTVQGWAVQQFLVQWQCPKAKDKEPMPLQPEELHNTEEVQANHIVPQFYQGRQANLLQQLLAGAGDVAGVKQKYGSNFLYRMGALLGRVNV